MEMDVRLKDLSYSSLLTLHSCPRKYELYKLEQQADEEDETVASAQNVTFAFGHIVGEGIQEYFITNSVDKAIWKMFLGWHADLFADNAKQMKSFWHAVYAIQKFAAMRAAGLLDGYEVVYYEEKPAVELGFCINFPDGFRYRGFVDVVLRHKVSGKIMVVEVKTTSAKNLHPAMYKNSAQAVGYSIVLDAIFPSLSSYEVYYLVYCTKELDFGPPLIFPKSFVQRALWIQELLLDIELIKKYAETGVFPMHGESCFDWYRQCGYFGICTISNTNLFRNVTPPSEPKQEVYQINLTIADLLQAQLMKASTQNV